MARGRQLTDAEREALRLEARALGSASARPFCECHAELLGCHWSTVYRTIRDELPNRKRRSDAGTVKAFDEQGLDDLAALVVQHDYDAELALDTVNANRAREGEEAFDAHPETLRRILRGMGVSRRDNAQDLRVHRRFEAPHPGYLYQMDSTVAASWWIDTDDTVGYEAPVALNKTKAGNEKPRIWLLGVIDDHSRVRWARFYTANSALAWRDMLIRVMRGVVPDTSTWPARGIPERLYSDQDSAMKARVMTRTLDLLNIERMLAQHSTEAETNAQAKGKVERSLGVIMTGFEKTLRAKRVSSLKELNRLLLRYLIWTNNRPHSETGVAPFERWLSARTLRVLPPEEVMARVLRREVTRRISADLSIRLEGKAYQLPRRKPFVDYVKKTVSVFYHEADLSTISVMLDGEEHEVGVVEAVPDEAGEWKKADTPAAVAKKRELQKRDLTHIDPLIVHDYRVDRDTRTYAYRPELIEIAAGREMAPVLIRRGKATDRAQAAGLMAAPPTAEERAALSALFGGRKEIPEPELVAWMNARRGGGPGHVRQVHGA